MRKIFERLLKLVKNEYFLISAVLILGFVVRLYKINNPIADWHSWRQADTASVTKIYVKDGIDLLRPRYHDISSIQTGFFNPEGLRYVEFPLYNAAHALLVKYVGIFSLEVWGRLLSIIIATASTFLIYLIGKRYMGKWGGILSAFFFSFIPFNIFFTRVILPEPLGVLFGLLGLYFFTLFIDNDKKVPLYLSGAFFALGMLIKPFIFFYLIPVAYLALVKYSSIKKILRNSKILVPLLVFAFIMLIPFFAWRIFINLHPIGIPHFKWAFNGDDIRFKPSFWRWIFAERVGKLVLGVWGLIPFVFALLGKLKSKFPYFTHFFLFGMFLYVSIFATASVRHDYYQTIVIPAIALAMAQGTMEMWNTKAFNKYFARTILAFSLFVMFITTATDIKAFYMINHPEIIEAGQAVDRLTPKDALIIAPYNGDTAFLYQTNRSGWPVVDTSIDKLVEQGADYYVSVNYADPDTLELMDTYKIIERTSRYVIINLHEKK